MARSLTAFNLSYRSYFNTMRWTCYERDPCCRIVQSNVMLSKFSSAYDGMQSELALFRVSTFQLANDVGVH